MGLMGQVATNDGTWRVDGRQVKEFAYASGTGSLPAIGDTITDSGGASGKVIHFNSGTAASGVMTVTQQSGTFAASNTLSSGSFSATLSSVKVGYLQVFLEDNNNTKNDSLFTQGPHRHRHKCGCNGRGRHIRQWS